MLSNPVSIYISGSEEVQFEYKPGNIAFHFSPYDNGLDSTLLHLWSWRSIRKALMPWKYKSPLQGINPEQG